MVLQQLSKIRVAQCVGLDRAYVERIHEGFTPDTFWVLEKGTGTAIKVRLPDTVLKVVKLWDATWEELSDMTGPGMEFCADSSDNVYLFRNKVLNIFPCDGSPAIIANLPFRMHRISLSGSPSNGAFLVTVVDRIVHLVILLPDGSYVSSVFGATELNCQMGEHDPAFGLWFQNNPHILINARELVIVSITETLDARQIFASRNPQQDDTWRIASHGCFAVFGGILFMPDAFEYDFFRFDKNPILQNVTFDFQIGSFCSNGPDKAIALVADTLVGKDCIYEFALSD